MKINITHENHLLINYSNYYLSDLKSDEVLLLKTKLGLKSTDEIIGGTSIYSIINNTYVKIKEIHLREVIYAIYDIIDNRIK